ncbi:MAG: hypothetical protein V4508_17405 [Pseudomonadota bacterium]
MEVIFEILFEFLGEVVLQLVFEVMAEFGLHSLSEPFKKKPQPWLAALGYVLFGALAGAISLWIFPRLFATTMGGRLLNLLFAPVVSGLAMVAIGMWRIRRDQETIRLDKFAYGYLFALAMATMRFGFGN